MVKMIEIDGSTLEGGGQLLRTSIALSAVTGKAIKIFNIRAKRPKPGLAAQHLHAIKAVAQLTAAEVKGLGIGSTTIEFSPKETKGGNFKIEIGTAGSITLVLQALMPPAAFASTKVVAGIIGGTDVMWSPPIDYVKNILVSNLAKMGYLTKIELLQRGYYPKGGGVVKIEIEPIKFLQPLKLVEFGEVISIKGISYSTKLPEHVVKRQAESAQSQLNKNGFKNVDINVELDTAGFWPGSGIVLWAETSTGARVGASSFGKRGKPAEQVGREASRKLIEELMLRKPVDRYVGDQLLPYLALADGFSEIATTCLTLHALTNIYVIEKILDVKFYVDGIKDQPAKIEVNGVGFKSKM